MDTNCVTCGAKCALPWRGEYYCDECMAKMEEWLANSEKLAQEQTKEFNGVVAPRFKVCDSHVYIARHERQEYKFSDGHMDLVSTLFSPVTMYVGLRLMFNKDRHYGVFQRFTQVS